MVVRKKKTQYEHVRYFWENDDAYRLLNHPFHRLIGLLGAQGWEIVQVDGGPGSQQDPRPLVWRLTGAYHDCSWILFKRRIVDEEPPVLPSLGDPYRWREVEWEDE